MLTLVKTNLLEDVTNKEATNNNYTEMNLKYNNYSNSNTHNNILFITHLSYGLSKNGK